MSLRGYLSASCRIFVRWKCLPKHLLRACAAAGSTMPSPRLSDSGSSVNNRSSVSAAHAGEFYMRSLLGAQAESRHETAPRYGFGTGQRAAYDIMYGGPGTDKGRPCRLSPGPIYMPGAGPDSWRGPKFSFGTGPPAGSCGASANKGSAQQPGPGDYELSDAVGPQYSSLARNAPKFTWGSTVRDTGGVKVHCTRGLPRRHSRSHAHAAGFLTATASTPPARHAPAAKARSETKPSGCCRRCWGEISGRKPSAATRR